MTRLQVNMSTGALLISQERERQKKSEGFTEEHDDSQNDGILAILAAELAIDSTNATIEHDCESDSRGLCAKHRDTKIKQLVVAGALIAAEIDREMRIDIEY